MHLMKLMLEPKVKKYIKIKYLKKITLLDTVGFYLIPNLATIIFVNILLDRPFKIVF